MKRHLLAVAVCFALIGCGDDPYAIVLGPNAIQQLTHAEQRSFQKLTFEERQAVLLYIQVGQTEMGLQPYLKNKVHHQYIGFTVGQILAASKKEQEEAETLKRQEAERQAFIEEEAARQRAENEVREAQQKEVERRLTTATRVSVLSTDVLPMDIAQDRPEDLLVLTYSIENRTEKDMCCMKGIVTFFDVETGKKVGALEVEFGQSIKAKETLETTSGKGWEVKSNDSRDVKDISRQHLSAMRVTFTPTLVVFEDGETLSL